jgi:nicotinamidase-related amidase
MRARRWSCDNEPVNEERGHLLEVDDSVLIVIDVQESFLAKLDTDERAPLVARIAWLVDVANALGVPIVATAEDMSSLGGLVPEIEARLPPSTPTLNKMVFGLADDPEVYPVAQRLGRRTAVLAGLETDVCIAHSALGLLDRGVRVAVLSDATGSPGASHEAGLARMRGAGVVETTAKGLFYEWTRTVRRAESLRAELPDPPDGIVL